MEIKTDEELSNLFQRLNKYTSQENEFYLKLYVPLVVVIGDYLAKKYHHHWELSTVYTFQPYVIPHLKCKNNYEFRLWGILDQYFESKYFDFKDFLWKVTHYNKKCANI